MSLKGDLGKPLEEAIGNFENLPSRTQQYFKNLGLVYVESRTEKANVNAVFHPRRIYEDLENYERRIVQSDEIQTLLTFACSKLKPVIVQQLLKKNADVNQIDPQGNPPLYYLINRGKDHSEKVCEILSGLLEREDIDFTIKCHDGRTVLDHILVPTHRGHPYYKVEDLFKIDPDEASPELKLLMKAIADKIVNVPDFNQDNFEGLSAYFRGGQDKEFYREIMDCLMEWHELSLKEKARTISPQKLQELNQRLLELQYENLDLRSKIFHLQDSRNENLQQPKPLIMSTPISINNTMDENVISTNPKPQQ